MIPAAFRAALDKGPQPWRDMLGLLDKLEAGHKGVSPGHIDTDWWLFKESFPEKDERAAEMLITGLYCLCRYRPKLFEELFFDAYEPLFRLDVKYPNEMSDWYKSRSGLDAHVKQWIEDMLVNHFNWLQNNQDPELESDSGLAGLFEEADNAAVTCRELSLTNYNEIIARALFVFLLLGLGMLPVLLSGHLGALWLSVPFLLLALVVGVSLTRSVASMHLADSITVQQMMQLPLQYPLQELRHIHLRTVKTRLNLILSVYKHIYADFEFRDGREFAVRLDRREGKALAGYLKARGFASCMEKTSSRHGIEPMVFIPPSGG